MRLAASSFYHEPKGDTTKASKDADLRDKIETICLEFPRYSYWRVTAALQQQGLWVNHKSVLYIMTEDGNRQKAVCRSCHSPF